MQDLQPVRLPTWEIALPPDWLKRAETEDGEIYFESEDGTKGMYIATWRLGDEAQRGTSTQVARSFRHSALASLEAMGKHPSQNVRHYKPAEMRVRELLRRITTLRNDASIEQRPAVVECERRLTAVHETLLDGVMSKRPRS